MCVETLHNLQSNLTPKNYKNFFESPGYQSLAVKIYLSHLYFLIIIKQSTLNFLITNIHHNIDK